MRLWKFFRGNGRESAAPGAASGGPGRRAVEFCWAIRRPSTRTMRTRVAALSPKDAVAVPSRAATAACLATWAGGLLFGVDGVAGLRFRHAGGCLPRPRDRLGRRDSPGFDQGPWFVPSCPVNPERFQEAAALPRPDVTYSRSCHGLAHPSRFAPAASNAATWRIRADGVHLPMRSATLGVAGRVAPGRRQPQATAAAPVPDFHRPSVVQSVGRHLPTTWPRGHKWTASDYTRHQGGTKKRMLSSLAAAGRNADLAPRHYRIFATASHAAQQRCDVVRHPG